MIKKSDVQGHKCLSVIMHNIIMESESDSGLEFYEPHQVPVEYADFVTMHDELHQLQDNLVEHSWVLKENQAI
jgi:hypothetical protein